MAPREGRGSREAGSRTLTGVEPVDIDRFVLEITVFATRRSDPGEPDTDRDTDSISSYPREYGGIDQLETTHRR